MAYMRDSCSGLPTGEMHAATAASPAFAFQVRTASPSGPACETGPASVGPATVASIATAMATTSDVRRIIGSPFSDRLGRG
jgi:hypothetical protein